MIIQPAQLSARQPIGHSLDIQRDRYLLQIPWEAPNAVFWPIVGVYKVDTFEHLPVHAQEGTTLGDSYRLAAVKVLSQSDCARAGVFSRRPSSASRLICWVMILSRRNLRYGQATL